MLKTILFKDLPFEPDTRQIIFIDNRTGGDDATSREYGKISDMANRLIEKEYDRFRKFAEFEGKELIYFPKLYSSKEMESKVRYYAPYLESDISYPELPQSSMLLDYLSGDEDRENIPPCLITYAGSEGETQDFLAFTFESYDKESLLMEMRYALTMLSKHIGYECGDESDDYLYGDQPSHASVMPAEDRDEEPPHMCCDSAPKVNLEKENRSECPTEAELDARFEELIQFKKEEEEADRLAEEERRRLEAEESKRPSFRRKLGNKLTRWLTSFDAEESGDIGSSGAGACPRPVMKSEGEDVPVTPYEEEDDVHDIMSVLEESVKQLRMRGVTLMAIHEMIDKQEKLSRILITPDYRIFLPDYGNMEIEMGVLPKALFFLFLRYPDGIRLKEMQDHYNELYNIYSQLKPNFKEARLRVTITEVVNPLNNRLNENIARIRAAFLKKFDEHLAQHYFVHGTKGETYSIDIDRNLIEWQE